MNLIRLFLLAAAIATPTLSFVPCFATSSRSTIALRSANEDLQDSPLTPSPTYFIPTPVYDFSATTVVKLKQICKDRGLLTTGKKADLVARLDALVASPPLISAALGRPTPRPPIWLFRQAGRHLPEYTAHKQLTSSNFLQLLDSPPSVAECTLQPCRRYPIDAAILFSDILVIPAALGVDVVMPGGVGVQIPEPLTTVAAVNNLIAEFDKQESPSTFIETKLSHVLESIRLIRTALASELIPVPLIGFSAAPFTLMYYMLGGSSKKNNDVGVQWLKEETATAEKLMDTLSTIVIAYLDLQVRNGAQCLQLFEAMGMFIDEPLFKKHALPCLARIAEEVKALHPDVPLMVFSRGANYANAELSKLGYDVITIDGSVSREKARASANGKTVQGDFKPQLLVSGEGTSEEVVQEEVKNLIQGFGGKEKLIVNLCEGLGGKESVDLVRVFVDAVHAS